MAKLCSLDHDNFTSDHNRVMLRCGNWHCALQRAKTAIKGWGTKFDWSSRGNMAAQILWGKSKP
jgi:hypothetical protein